MTTTQERYAAAVRAVRAAGVTVRLNVQSSTMGSTTLDQLGVSDGDRDRHAWTWAGQGNRLVWRGGEPYRADKARKLKPWHWQNATLTQRARFTQVYWYHGGPGIEAAQVVWAAFRGQRFEVDWDGTAGKAVVVKFPPCACMTEPNPYEAGGPELVLTHESTCTLHPEYDGPLATQ